MVNSVVFKVLIAIKKNDLFSIEICFLRLRHGHTNNANFGPRNF